MWAQALIASATFFGAVMAEEGSSSDKEFPLVWVCLGITVVGVMIALYVAYRRPDELHLPGTTVMVSTESEEVSGKNEPAKKSGGLNDDLENV
ncbi:hypothetical protein LSM04_009326 [Trypanosoma melophagium]|uniref:uncharacterized protein n=1 Tax=Trypanosoma melophagium TaxID=715481 RepID=UPI003519E943|nr:hypothetical protein LSM04_005902 [Trypanosoma melophagium]KAH9599668.1 hypothetical protein LSM04_009326 [Trypanosoma melophagium]